MQIMTSNEVYASEYLHHGIEHFRRNEFAAAIANFDMALRYRPDDNYARYNRSTALLSLGDYSRGFPEYEVAWRLFHWRGFGPVKQDIDRISHLPVWKGEHHVRVLVYHEMGFGDAIMAMRYLPELNRRADITLVIDPCLARLARGFNVEVEAKVPNDVREYDFRLPFFGVMAALGETEDTIPSEPYLLCKKATGPHGPVENRVGIAWMGRTQTSFTLERFLQLADLSGFKLFSLLPGPMPDPVEPLLPGCDFADVADRIACMDHIVSVDTAAVHLAGAMGHRSAHLLLPYLSDWRWHRTELWYPQLKTYRQPTPDDWTTPFAQLNEALR